MTPVDRCEKEPKVIDIMNTDELSPMELRTLEDALVHYQGVAMSDGLDAVNRSLVIKDIRKIIEKLTGEIR